MDCATARLRGCDQRLKLGTSVEAWRSEWENFIAVLRECQLSRDPPNGLGLGRDVSVRPERARDSGNAVPAFRLHFHDREASVGR
jgi:hypothetical protein